MPASARPSTSERTIAHRLGRSASHLPTWPSSQPPDPAAAHETPSSGPGPEPPPLLRSPVVPSRLTPSSPRCPPRRLPRLCPACHPGRNRPWSPLPPWPLRQLPRPCSVPRSGPQRPLTILRQDPGGRLLAQPRPPQRGRQPTLLETMDLALFAGGLLALSVAIPRPAG
eukprot:scaffold429_cov269-Pinguiococcus_pyrenoidosus.AAC.16